MCLALITTIFDDASGKKRRKKSNIEINIEMNPPRNKNYNRTQTILISINCFASRVSFFLAAPNLIHRQQQRNHGENVHSHTRARRVRLRRTNVRHIKWTQIVAVRIV